MFFSLENVESNKFPCHYAVGKLVLNTDLGWNTKTINNKFVVYKGYADLFPLENLLEEIIEEKNSNITGNYCVFIYSNEIIQIKTDLYRGFPIFYNSCNVSNLYQSDKKVLTNQQIKVYQDFKLDIDVLDLFCNLDNFSGNEKESIDYIHDLLNNKISKFLSYNTLPVKCFLSGGIDSMLVFSYIKKFCEYKIVDGEFYEFDYFTLKNNNDIKKNWAYKQINHFRTNTLWTSGAPGDEFMLRSPETSNLFCLSVGTDILSLLSNKKYENCLHKFYFNKENNRQLYKLQQTKNNKIFVKSPELTKKIIFNQILNDYQHHHLGNTITYTPLRDLNITNCILNLPKEIVFDQIMDSKLSKFLIEKNDKNLLHFLSTYKNYENYMENLIGLVI